MKNVAVMVRAACMLVFLATTGAAWSQQLQFEDSAVVARRGGVEITLGMVDQKIASMPEEIRAGYLDDPSRVARLIDSLLLTKQLAAEAERHGGVVEGVFPNGENDLDRLNILANQMLAKYAVLKSDMDYELLARERYQARKSEYASEAVFVLRHLAVDAAMHGRVAAKLIAENARAKALDGADFPSLIKEYGANQDAQDVRVPVSELLRAPEMMMRAVSSVGSQPGISEVVEDESGYHIFQVVKYEAPVTPAYDDIRGTIIEQLKQESITGSKTTFMRSLSLQEVELNDPVVQALATRYHDEQAPASDILETNPPS